MSLQSPLIDSRTQDDILANIQTLALAYTPEWDATQTSGAGAALMEIFADFVDGLIQRLNEAPNNNLIAFLNMLGVQLLPAQPALVPLTFVLSSGANQPVTIPERSQAAANPPGGSPIVFETQAAILATPASLEAILSVVPETVVPLLLRELVLFRGILGGLIPRERVEGDLILNDLAALQSGPTRLFDPTVENLQSHVLYLGDSNLFNLSANGASISLQLTGSANAATVLNEVDWSWTDLNGNWTSFSRKLDDQTLTLTKSGTDQIQQVTVNGIQSRWIRAVAFGPKTNDLAQLSLTNITVQFPQSSVPPDAAFANDVPLPTSPSLPSTTGPWLPFATLPRQGDAFYIASQDAFSKAGAKVTLSFSLVAWPPAPTPAPPTGLSAEVLVVPDASIASPAPALPPLTLAPASGAAQAGVPYSSAVVASGGSSPFFYSIVNGSLPPGLTLDSSSGAITGTPTTPGTFNFTARVTDARRQSAEADCSIMLPPPNLSWEYWNGSGWTALQVTDDTSSLLNRGDVSFTVPSDLAQTTTGGKSAFWIRVRLASGDYGQVIYTPGNPPNASGVQYPRIANLTIGYSVAAQTPANVMSFNNGSYQIYAPNASGSFTPFQPFIPLDDVSQALYLGFDEAPLSGPISIFFDLAAQAYPPVPPRLEWQYYAQSAGQPAGQWNRLTIVDGTQGLTQPGTVQFLGPSDFAQLSRYGYNLFWIRAQDVSNGFQQPTSQSSVTSGPVLRLLATPIIEASQIAAASRSAAQVLPLPLGTGIDPALARIDAETPCGQLGSFSAPFAGGTPSTSLAPVVNNIYLNTAWAIQAETITGETLGSSDASQNQQYQLTKFPVVSQQIEVDEFASLFASERTALAADKSVTTEQVTDANGDVTQFWVEWTPIDDLSTAGPNDRVYAIDPTFGTIQFGDGVTGMVPPVGFNNVQATYQYGGGSDGNVAAATITTLRTTIPLVDHVNNPLSAGGGSDTEQLNSAVQRGSEGVKNRGRAVSVEDYQWLATAASRDVARVLVLPDFNDAGESATNWVTVLIVPGTSDPRPYPSFELQQIVQNSLLACAPCVTTAASQGEGQIRVSGPTYVDVDVSADVYPVSISQAPQLETAAVTALQSFLHPLTGGPNGQGWDFGTLPCLSDFYGLLGALSGVDHIENLSMNIYVVNPDGSGAGAPTTIDQSHPFNSSLPPYVLIASGNHSITIQLSNSGSSS